MRLRHKIAVVTGAASGIGRGIAVRFAEEGADVALADINFAGLEETAQQVRGLGRRVVVQEMDVRDRTRVEHLVNSTLVE